MALSRLSRYSLCPYLAEENQRSLLQVQAILQRAGLTNQVLPVWDSGRARQPNSQRPSRKYWQSGHSQKSGENTYGAVLGSRYLVRVLRATFPGPARFTCRECLATNSRIKFHVPKAADCRGSCRFGRARRQSSRLNEIALRYG